VSSRPYWLKQRWILRGVLHDYLIAKASALTAAETRLRPVPVVFVLANLDRWLACPAAARVLHELYQEVTGHSLTQLIAAERTRASQYLRLQLSEHLGGGGLVARVLDPAGDGLKHGDAISDALRMLRQDVSLSSLATEDSNSPATSGVAKASTWVEITLVGEDDQPLPGERYRLRLPSGEVLEGTLGADGCARVTGIPHGRCMVSFPDLDAQAWEPL
jgi:hypothetical protein